MAKKKTKIKNTRRKKSLPLSKNNLVVLGIILIILLLLGIKFLKDSAAFKANYLSETSTTTYPTSTKSYNNSTTRTTNNNPESSITEGPTKSPNPTVSSAFAPISPNNILFGQVTQASCDGISGFTFEVANGGTTSYEILQIQSSGGTGSGGVANLPSSDVNEFYKISGNHRFTHELPGIMDGQKHKYVVTAFGGGSQFTLIGTPIELTCP